MKKKIREGLKKKNYRIIWRTCLKKEEMNPRNGSPVISLSHGNFSL
jgi:hypothetical protein